MSDRGVDSVAPGPRLDLADRAACDALIESILASVLLSYGQIPGAAHREDADLLWIRGGRPFASVNHVLRLRMRPDGFEERVVAVLETFEPDAFPVTWWVGPTSEPRDVGERLRALGFRQEEEEFGMILDLSEPIDEPVVPPGVSIEHVDDELGLAALHDVMTAAYDWDADGVEKRRIYESMYRSTLGVAGAGWNHFLLRLDGLPAASSSVRLVGGQAFVTNIGTAPFARGRGLGTAATVATLHLARRLGYPTAVLTASVDGRGLYRRLGFREYGVLERYVATPDVLEGTRNRG
jgi:ribosomal protein S18 acetylase RimI-like enzyme